MPTHATLQHVAERLGVGQQTAYDWLRAGRLTNANPGGTVLIASGDVARIQLERRAEALRRIGDEVDYARRIRALIWPDQTVPLRADGQPDAAAATQILNAPRGRDALRSLPSYAVMLWGPDVLRAAATEWPRGTCGVCWARLASVVHETRGPDGSAACRVLLGDPCSLDTAAWAQQRAQNRETLTRLRQQQEGRARLDRRERLAREVDAAHDALQAASRRHTAAVAAARAAGIPSRRAREMYS